MTIKNKRKHKYKVPLLVDLVDIPKDWDIDKWVDYYKQTGLIVLNEGELTKREYEERKNNK